MDMDMEMLDPSSQHTCTTYSAFLIEMFSGLGLSIIMGIFRFRNTIVYS